jgi:adenylate cyclase
MRNRLRLYSGLILFVFVTGHLFNHTLGLVSLKAMEAARSIFIKPWRTVIGTVLLLGAGIVHVGVALGTLWVRRNLKLRAWEAAQLGLGLVIPLLLAAHVTATRVLIEISPFESQYATVLMVLAVASPFRGIVQGVTLLVVWTHGCIGLHTWLRLKAGYVRVQLLAFAAAVLVPALALAGYFVAAGRVRDLARDGAWFSGIAKEAGLEPWMKDFVLDTETKVQIAVVVILALIMAARAVRGYIRERSKKPRLYYSPGNRVVELQAEGTLLETIREAGIPHASVCGGRGRCSTCRVRIGRGLDDLDAAGADERKVLARITESPSVRLACQIRPRTDIEAVALVPADASPKEAIAKPGYRQGREMALAFLFVDLRDSTGLSENRLPFDVVFLLNQFFAELGAAIEETNGHYAQFNGDGLMAIYGLESGTEKGAGEAIAGAKAMISRLAVLNERLRGELTDDLRIGIGIHTGNAVVGSMGPPDAPIVTALGDNVNVAARLEAQTKELAVPLVISAETARLGGVDLSAFPLHTIQVKGRVRPLDVYAVDDPAEI